jgi:hypothetical protein
MIISIDHCVDGLAVAAARSGAKNSQLEHDESSDMI